MPPQVGDMWKVRLSVSQAEAMFETSMQRYSMPFGSTEHSILRATSYTIPAEIADAVSRQMSPTRMTVCPTCILWSIYEIRLPHTASTGYSLIQSSQFASLSLLPLLDALAELCIYFIDIILCLTAQF